MAQECSACLHLRFIQNNKSVPSHPKQWVQHWITSTVGNCRRKRLLTHSVTRRLKAGVEQKWRRREPPGNPQHKRKLKLGVHSVRVAMANPKPVSALTLDWFKPQTKDSAERNTSPFPGIKVCLPRSLPSYTKSVAFKKELQGMLKKIKQTQHPAKTQHKEQNQAQIRHRCWNLSMQFNVTMNSYEKESKYKFSASVQLHSRAWLFATPWTAARQASLSITNSQSLLKLMSIKSVMPPNHLILCRPLLLLLSVFPTSGPFQMSQFFTSGGQNVWVSAYTSVLPMNIQDWFPL